MQLLFFHGTFCPPCASTQRAAEQYAAETGVPLYTFRCDDVYGGNDMARQNHVRHIPCLILKADDGKELARTACAHTLETLHLALDAAWKGGETQ
ncbi:thioredoxin family protein [uncultured Ruminococcus sp.]|uniref:thioredoxin family protein n=1 Tax=uncultured Ruminococcus sp. TaxID=165186 RepID=UPI00265992A9|nr:thioredoxin family protein [uncultured Ruminococcus sp.]